MTKPLKRVAHDGLYHYAASGDKLAGRSLGLWGDCSGLWGDCSDLSGNCSYLSGDCSGLWGDCSDLRGDLGAIPRDARPANIADFVEQQP